MNSKVLKSISIIILLFVSYTFSNAQVFTTNEVRQYMSKGEQNGIEIILNGTSMDNAKDGLKKLAKKYDAKLVSEKKSPQLLIDNAQIRTVSANTVDIYVILTPIDKGTKATFFTDLGGAFITSAAYGTQYAGMEAVIKDFAQSQALESSKDQLKDEEKSLKTLNKDLKSLQKNKDKALKYIEKAKAEIQKQEKIVAENDAAQQAKQQQISLQKQIIETVKTRTSSLKK